jgi:hypothetical protein
VVVSPFAASIVVSEAALLSSVAFIGTSGALITLTGKFFEPGEISFVSSLVAGPCSRALGVATGVALAVSAFISVAPVGAAPVIAVLTP